jgi:hypothetical protein
MALLLVTMFALLLILVASDWAVAPFRDANGAAVVAGLAAVAGRTAAIAAAAGEAATGAIMAAVAVEAANCW